MEGHNMKRVLYVLLAICITLELGGCGKSNRQVETHDEIYLRLAEECTTYQEVYDLIKEYSEDKKEQEEFKKWLALLKGNETVQNALLSSEDLSPKLLILMLENPRWKNPHYYELVATIKAKVKDANLTPEQEITIAKIGNETAQIGLLMRDDICCEALSYIADVETTAIRNLNYCEYQNLFYQQGTREWNDEEKRDLINTENKNILEGLKNGFASK
jgi:hypothetical protein